ncbi:MAG: alpha/beta hydrolase [Saccharofermentans sp.]|nr:alpha/beta hydrolase [Saccharofermentans sp.]
MSKAFVKTLKTVNFISGTASSEEEIKRHRKLTDWAGRLATPLGDYERRQFEVGSIPCEEFILSEISDPDYAVLYCHGGGYVSGGLDYAANLAVKLAMATGFKTYSFAYRLAPEDPYPAASDDAYAVWNYLASNEKNIVLAGDSAGGNMALCLTQSLIAEGRPAPRLLLLFSPWTDMTITAGSYEENKDIDPILTKEAVQNSAKAYLGDRDPADPAFSPLFGSFEGFPPVCIMVGRNEILIDDSIRLKDKLEEAGIPASLDIEEKGWHVYQQTPTALSRKAMKRLGEYVSCEIDGKR